ncbi:uncharacterized protein DFL_008715 [Arthrobotrys flagrans]|uniref:Uncharacterized protein n=1 Tax=Arthrobotrys flagrans TaxID=97331 RepID=A0A436ZPN8_ARTFL|nr:hypothetical protein DFL_008715 [Arthrobotrys flagrans]
MRRPNAVMVVTSRICCVVLDCQKKFVTKVSLVPRPPRHTVYKRTAFPSTLLKTCPSARVLRVEVKVYPDPVFLPIENYTKTSRLGFNPIRNFSISDRRSILPFFINFWATFYGLKK